MEQFFQSHQYTIQAISATATCIAVITSLVMSWKALHTKKKAFKLNNLLAEATVNFEESKGTDVRYTDKGFSFNIENILEYSMDIYAVHLGIISNNGEHSFIINLNEQINPISRKFIRVPLNRVFTIDEFDDALDMFVTIDSSFGQRKFVLTKTEFKQFNSILSKGL